MNPRYKSAVCFQLCSCHTVCPVASRTHALGDWCLLQEALPGTSARLHAPRSGRTWLGHPHQCKDATERRAGIMVLMYSMIIYDLGIGLVCKYIYIYHIYIYMYILYIYISYICIWQQCEFNLFPPPQFFSKTSNNVFSPRWSWCFIFLFAQEGARIREMRSTFRPRL